MSLKKTQVGNIPKDTFRLTKEDAINFQRTRLSEWKPPSEVFFLKWGSCILGGVSAISSGFILNFFRYKLRLERNAMFSSYAAVMAIPGLGAGLAQDTLVKSSILIEDRCPVCNEIRSMLFQVGLGIVQPTILAMITSFGMAKDLYTYPIPKFNPVNPTKFYNFVGKMFKEARVVYGGILLASLVATSFVTYKQYSELPTLNNDSVFTYQRLTK